MVLKCPIVRGKARNRLSITTGKWCRTNCIKSFKERYREEKHQLAFLKPLSSLAGLKVCSRYIVTKEEHTSAIEKSEDLANSIVMPWIEDSTWADILQEQRMLSKEQCFLLQKHFLQHLK